MVCLLVPASKHHVFGCGSGGVCGAGGATGGVSPAANGSGVRSVVNPAGVGIDGVSVVMIKFLVILLFNLHRLWLCFCLHCLRHF